MHCNYISLVAVLCCYSSAIDYVNAVASIQIPTKVLSPGDCLTHSNDSTSATHQESQSVMNAFDSFLAQYRSPPPPCGNGTGWTRVIFMNMSDTSVHCPSSLTLHDTPAFRGCGRKSTGLNSCDSVHYSLYGRRYSQVCGRILAYQKGTPEAFLNYHYYHHGIDSAYVDGVSLTHGPIDSRKHIWTFAGVLYEEDPRYNTRLTCPCTNTQYNWTHQIPEFVGNHYFCDTGNEGPGYNGNAFYTSDPLWDGEGCGPHSTCCQLNSPPWFHRDLLQTTNDDIELRVCFSSRDINEDVILYLVDVYVK